MYVNVSYKCAACGDLVTHCMTTEWSGQQDAPLTGMPSFLVHKCDDGKQGVCAPYQVHACVEPGSRRLAPWKDFKGAPIHEGDTIEHPDGAHGVVMFYPNESTVHKQWRVRYSDSSYDHALFLQIGDRGMAAVVPK